MKYNPRIKVGIKSLCEEVVTNIFLIVFFLKNSIKNKIIRNRLTIPQGGGGVKVQLSRKKIDFFQKHIENLYLLDGMKWPKEGS